MPGVIQSRHKRLAVSLSDDDEESDTSSVSIGSKRARYALDASNGSTITNGHRSRLEEQNEDDSNEEYDGERWQPGSLVRVKLKNFVTYTAAEFNPGPSLNMVIGPNGTGKSTLVCAICLGLGWSPEHLGRAKEIGAFVKHGSPEAEIEIELAGQEGRPNQVIRRVIRKEGNKSVFFHNDRHITQKQVQSLARSFSIQIDNLCQFLPQDRVVEFAKLEPVELLRETQRAVAPNQMIEWHDQLKNFRGREKELQVKQQTEENHLKGLENQQNATRDDVRRWNEREELEKKRKALEKCRPIIELSVLRNEIKGLKHDLNTARRELDQINSEVEPVRLAQEEIEAYHGQIDQVMKLRRNRVEMARTQADKALKTIDTEKEVVTASATEVETEVKAKKLRERDITRIDGDINRLERSRQERPVEYDRSAYDGRIAECRNKITAAAQRQTEVDVAIKNMRYRAGDLKSKMNEAKTERAQLDTQSGQQANLLSRLSPETHRAWNWIQENKSTLQLKGEIYGPPILTCSVQDPKLYANAIESQLRKGDFIAITCTNNDDAKLISNELFGKRNFHEIFLRTSPRSLSAYQAPVPQEQLQNFGFTGWLVDYVKGPDPVLAMLCDNTKLHRTAFSPRPISNEQHTAAQSSPIQKWVSGGEIYQITTRREYGASSTAVTQVRKAQYFVDQPVNTQEKNKLDDDIKGFEREYAELMEEHGISKRERSELEEQQKQWKNQKDEIEAELNRLKKAIAEWQALPQKIELKQAERDSLANQNAQTNARIRAIKAKSRESSIKLTNWTLEYAKSVTMLRTFHESLVEAEIRLIEANSERKALKAENAEVLRSQKEKEREIHDLDAHYQDLRRKYQQLHLRTQEDINSLEEEERAFVRDCGKFPTMQDLESEIQTVQARLEMMADGNPHAVKKYEERARLIESAQQKLAEIRDELAHFQQQITEIRAQWEPQLDALVSRISDGFSHNFQKIGCAGQVSVYKDEDFENWSIQIQVRFRENESLSILDSHRQSGGERAVSTIFYLMALQDLARSPFRVVDEINQGMDPRNERMVHERMVDIACRKHTSQYFLITPKLLPGLKYHPKMKVHCIASGEHMPDSKHNLNFKDLAAIALRVKKGIMAGA